MNKPRNSNKKTIWEERFHEAAIRAAETQTKLDKLLNVLEVQADKWAAKTDFGDPIEFYTSAQCANQLRKIVKDFK